MKRFSRSTLRATNQFPTIKRRAFIRTTAGGAAGVVLGACKTERNTVTRVTILTQPPTSVAHTAATVPLDTSAPSTTDGTSNSAAATVWRLSTRNQRSPCGACKAHAAHRFFSSADAAEAGRAHAGCTCEVREQRTALGRFQNWFAEGDQVFDDRWT